MSILPDIADVHQAIRQWGCDYEAILRPYLDVDADDPRYLAWLEKAPQGVDDRLMRVYYAQEHTVPPVWPTAALPAWATHATVDGILGGEVVVSLDWVSEVAGGYEIEISGLVHVVIFPAVGREPFEEGMKEVGDHIFGNGIQMGWAGPGPWDGSSWQEVEAFGNALLLVAAKRREIEGAELAEVGA